MHEVKRWYRDQKIQRTLAALKKNGFQTFFAPTRRDAREKALSLIPSDAVVGVGGSITIREINLIDSLTTRGNTVVQHWLPPPGEDTVTTMRKEIGSDIFLSSSNAVTEDGKLINTDGTGNRVAAMIFGPRKAIVIAGVNKIVKDVAEGIQRVKNVAAPMNARRLNKQTPCAVTGVCTDCDSPNRICRVTTIMEKKPDETDVTVILVGEELGF
ncbi:MAG: lactate utilization protein [Candidatus Bathyarchaeia archaeon]